MKALTSNEERGNSIEKEFTQALNAGRIAVESAAENDPNTAFKSLVVAELNKLSPQSGATKTHFASLC